jgi:hypothetical protein
MRRHDSFKVADEPILQPRYVEGTVSMWSHSIPLFNVLGMVVVIESREQAMICHSRRCRTATARAAPAPPTTRGDDGAGPERRHRWIRELRGAASKGALERLEAFLDVLRRTVSLRGLVPPRHTPANRDSHIGFTLRRKSIPSI